MRRSFLLRHIIQKLLTKNICLAKTTISKVKRQETGGKKLQLIKQSTNFPRIQRVPINQSEKSQEFNRKIDKGYIDNCPQKRKSQWLLDIREVVNLSYNKRDAGNSLLVRESNG